MKACLVGWILVGLSAWGCSAIVNPDGSRLGGGMDAGPGPDGGGDAGLDSGLDASDDAGLDASEDAPALDAPGLDAGTDAGVCPGGCDDMVDCTMDECVAGSCEHAPDDGACGPGMRCNPGLGCVPDLCTADPECDDGLFCNGAERCAPGTAGADPTTGCVPGSPVDCNDDGSCTADSCDEVADMCVHTPDATACDDSVSCTRDACDPSRTVDPTGCLHTPDDMLCATGFCTTGGRCLATSGCFGGMLRDCRDGDPCTADSCDEAADMCVNVTRDDDDDGFPAAFVLSGGVHVMCSGSDCDDGNPDVHPGATEVCNGIDDNCNGMTDEGCSVPDDCSTAREIPLESGRGTVSGTLGSFASDYDTPCGTAGAPDAVYYITITGLVDIVIDTIGSATDTVLAVATTCAGDGFGLACNDDYDRGRTTQSRIFVHRFAPPPGSLSTRLYILVDGYSPSSTGAFTVNVRVGPADSDSCFGGAMNITGGGTAVGFLSGAAVGGPTGSCQMSSERFESNALFTLRSPGAGAVDLTARSRDFVPDLYVRQDPCGSGMEIACQRGSAVGGGVNQAMVSPTLAGDRTYWVFVDGASGGGTYQLLYDP